MKDRRADATASNQRGDGRRVKRERGIIIGFRSFDFIHSRVRGSRVRDHFCDEDNEFATGSSSVV